ncbi:MAG: sodium-translocating pyrophosphatase [Deltaproteobacteria bacterium]|nr:sodium-translocating pyrophosphatase [Deltaproteobacteria bacterium]
MRSVWLWLSAFAALLLGAPGALASEGDIPLPRFAEVSVGGMPATTLLGAGVGITVLGLVVGLVMFLGVQKLPVHQAMKDISELIYATCKTYVITQIKFIGILWGLVAVVVVAYFGVLHPLKAGPGAVVIILAYSLLGIAGSSFIAWFGMRMNNYANSASAFASLMGKPYPAYSIPLKAGMSIGMVLVSLVLLIMLVTLLVIPGDIAGACFIGFAIGTSLGAAALRIAGGIFTKIADVGSDLMKIVFKIKEDDARNPGVIADCAGDNAGDSVGPTADGFETYGVTAVALITFIMLAVAEGLRGMLITWIFVIAAIMILTSLLSYAISWFLDSAKKNADKMDFEAGLTRLIWITAIVSIAATFGVTNWLLGTVEPEAGLWWRMAAIMSCGTLAGALIPEVVKVFTSMKSGHVKEIVDASRQGASLNVLSGIIAGNFAAYWLGLCIMALMGVAYLVAVDIPSTVMQAPGVFAFGLLAFGFLSMGPVTIAVDSYGPVSDNAQSVYELSLVESLPSFKDEVKKQFGFDVDFDKAKQYLEDNDAAGNTFKATAKPVLIGTAVVGATTLIFSLVVTLTNGLTINVDKLSLLYPPFLLGLVLGGSVIFWFSGAATQAVATGAFRAVEFIRDNIKLDGSVEKASITDSQKVVQICTEAAQKGTFNIFLAVFFSALSFAFLNEWLFIGYLVAIALFGLFQANYMANAGGAWDNAKKLVEVELKAKGTPLHEATVVGDTVGDPYKDTSSVAMNPVIKFTSLFGILAVELAVGISSAGLRAGLAAVFFVVSAVFVYRSFYGMRIGTGLGGEVTVAATKKKEPKAA